MKVRSTKVIKSNVLSSIEKHDDADEAAVVVVMVVG